MGEVILVTGATDGLGRAVVGELAGGGATVVVHGRDRERGEAVVRELGGDARLELADLASLAEVRALAERVAAAGGVDVLVNNAGIGFTLPGDGARVESADGIELRFAVNYLAPFLLSELLLGAGAVRSRLVNVASVGQAELDFGDLQTEHGYDGYLAYRRSKLAMIMHTFDLAETHGSAPTVNALHPATLMPTKMVTHAGHEGVDTLETGLAATLRLIRDPALAAVTGRYYDRQEESRANAQAYDEGARATLRERSLQLAGAFAAPLGSG